MLISKSVQVHSEKCGVHSTPSSCHTIGCVSDQQNFGVLAHLHVVWCGWILICIALHDDMQLIIIAETISML